MCSEKKDEHTHEDEKTPCATYTTKPKCEEHPCDWHKDESLCSEKKDEHEEKSPGTDPNAGPGTDPNAGPVTDPNAGPVTDPEM